MSKEIDVPLNWEEIDEIIIALRFVEEVFNKNERNKLEVKLCDYSMKAKQVNSKCKTGCQGNCIYLGRPTYDYPCNECCTNNFKHYTDKE